MKDTILEFIRQYLRPYKVTNGERWAPDWVVHTDMEHDPHYIPKALVTAVKNKKVLYVEIRPLRDFGYYTVKES